MRLCDFAITDTIYTSDEFLYAGPICIRGNTMPTAGPLEVDCLSMKVGDYVLGNPSYEHCIKDLDDGLQSAFICGRGILAVFGQSLAAALEKVDECPVVSVFGPECSRVLLDVEIMLDGNVIAVDLETAEVSSTDYGTGRGLVA
ncbi:hypothetical protein RYZ26_19595 [Terasakiella sp. A23]|uniref:hypothetical protein n=1 Tax=Terasakiella sp. FCG-A23 TaxID=3080561 RepID=UPI0029548C23|nr:hypothetical protein [Terasakiella sp. A23]MDV7341809.1 hypothetical protein [Terasakiella sp. A23]